MANNVKFPPSAEVKRVIAAAIRAGIEIGSIEIHPRKIIIRPSEASATEISDFDIWKMSRGQDTERVGHSVEKTDALQKKSRR
jgi:hypothetical protein